MREDIGRWFKQGEEDLKTAKANIQEKRYYAAAFFCQQASEKVLKALYLMKKGEVPRHHNLVVIAKDLKAPREIYVYAAGLNPDYVITRYPDAANGLPMDDYTEEIAKEKVEKAEEIVKWARTELSSP